MTVALADDAPANSYAKIWARRQAFYLDTISSPQKFAVAIDRYARGGAAGFVDFINDYFVTHDPRRDRAAYIPFVLFPRQVEYVHWLYARYTNREDGLVEKCRDMGLTWLNVAFSVCLWLFRPGSKSGFGSRKEDLVDRIGDPDSIFEKIRTLIRWLPPEFIPTGFTWQHAGHLKLVNPATESTITGEAGDNIGRGGRNSIYFKDESSFYERPELIDAALSQNSDCKIDVSTPNGTGNPFYRKRFGGKIPVFVFDWRDDPRKDQSWYDRQKELLEPWILAQEVDRDYSASIEDVCIPAKWVQAALKIKLDATGRRASGLDVADEGESGENCLITRHGAVVESVEAWKEGNTTQTARRACGLCREIGSDVLFYDSIGVGAGVKGETASLRDSGLAGFQIQGVNAGDTDLPGLFEEGKTNRDMFLNLRAEMWWSMRRRCRKTYERVENIRHWPDEDCIQLVNDALLIAELSQPKYEHTEHGKIKIEGKKKMMLRGVKSPNRADALMLAFAPARLFRFEQFGGSMGRGSKLWGRKTGMRP